MEIEKKIFILLCLLASLDWLFLCGMNENEKIPRSCFQQKALDILVFY